MEDKEKSTEEMAEEQAENVENKVKEEEQDFKAMYDALLQEHNALKEKVAQEDNIRNRESTFAESGLKKTRYKMYHKYAEDAEDLTAMLKELMNEYPEDFEVEKTNNRNAFPTEKQEKKVERDEKAEQKEYLRKQGIGG